MLSLAKIPSIQSFSSPSKNPKTRSIADRMSLSLFCCEAR